jgi:iron complex transport system permease protein
MNIMHGSKRSRLGRLIVVLLVLLVVSVIFGVSLGSTTTPPSVVVKVLLSHIPGLSSWFSAPETAADAIIYKIRLPRVILALFVGAALATAGAALQGLLRNPLAEPYTIGVASGASVGAALVIVFIGGELFGFALLPFAAFLGAFLTALLVYRLALIDGHMAVETLILAGVVMSSFMSAILSYMLTLAGESLHQIVYWLMGSLGLRGSEYFIYTLPLLVAGVFLLCLYGRDLNILTFGEETAGQLGISVERTKRIILLLAALLTGIAVSLAGTIGFVGLIIPHLIRLILGPDHRVLLPVSALGGGIFLIWADLVARVATAPVELPVGVVTAFLGAPFFLYLLRNRKRSGY